MKYFDLTRTPKPKTVQRDCCHPTTPEIHTFEKQFCGRGRIYAPVYLLPWEFDTLGDQGQAGFLESGVLNSPKSCVYEYNGPRLHAQFP